MNQIFPFICVNYKSEEETLKYISNVLNLQFSKYAYVIVVDNSPAIESYDILNNYISENNLKEKVKILRCENKGYFYGLNVGIKWCKKELKSEYIIIGNNDILFQSDFIKILLNLDYQTEHLVIAPDIITTDNFHENPHVIEKMSFLRKLKYDFFFSHYLVAKFLRIFKSERRPRKKHDPIRKNIYMGIGALYILTPHFFTHFDSLWDKVFLYGEEAVLSGQIQSVKGKILYEPKLICHHNESSTTSKIPSKSKYEMMRTSYRTYRQYL